MIANYPPRVGKNPSGQVINADVDTLSHEVGEWMDDPFTFNPTPRWGRIPKWIASSPNGSPQPDCQTNLEVGDPLAFRPDISVAMSSGTFHVQELAYASWFYSQNFPSTGAGGRYSDGGTFTRPAWACGAHDYDGDKHSYDDLLAFGGVRRLCIRTIRMDLGLRTSTAFLERLGMWRRPTSTAIISRTSLRGIRMVISCF